nr:hypothetical protein [Tanacetum cinerariifolium]
CDPLALETKATPVEESTCVLESMFGEGDVPTDGFSDFVVCGVRLACLVWFLGVTATSSAGLIGFKDTALESTALPLSCSLRAVITKTFS